VPNLAPKEEQEEQQTDDVDGLTTEQRQSLAILRDNGADVTRTVLEIARQRSLDDVRGMLDAARRKRGLSNPIGWAIARLRDGAPAPAPDDGADGDGRARKRIVEACPDCYRTWPIERICEECGRCTNCCECKEQRPGRGGPERRGGREKEVTNSKNPTQDILPQKLEGGE
jgi:hypothetical protein